jgi:hypothetical protein
MPKAPCTPTQNHHIESPIWDCSITAVEAFFSDEPDKGDMLHACIERESWTGKKWPSNNIEGSSGATQKCSIFTTTDIERMIDNIPSASTTCRVSRVLTRNDTSRKIDKVTVCSVRVWYNDAAMFVDWCQTIHYINLQATTARRSAFLLFDNRDESDWHSWRRGDFILSTAEIKSIAKVCGTLWLAGLKLSDMR